MQQAMVHVNEVSIYETRGLVEQVIIRLKIKDISILELILNFDFVFDNESHIAKWECKILLKYKPIMIISIKSMTFQKLRPYLLKLLNILIIECLD